ncbi:MAG: non-ribosomal peptide synthase/polyketide synthase, partial [Acidobacteriota bacterium]
LGEVEAVLSEHPGVREAVALVREDQPGDQRLTAYAVARPGKKAEEGGRCHTLPNGMAVAHQNKNETEYLYQEIYGRRCYLQHGIELPEGAVVFDVGANIGMFTLFVSQHCPGVQLYSFEPLPPIFENLRENVERYGLPVKLYPMGMSDQEREAEFTYYRRHSMMSGQSDYADPELEAEVVKQSMRNAQASGAPGMEALLEMADQLLEGRFEGERHRCRLGRLSDLIRQEGIERIDLLKVDCQRAELDVLRGLEEEDWGKIDQIVMEVHDAPGLATEGRLGEVVGLLQEKGFEAFAEQDELLIGTDRHNLYAIRRGRRLRAVREAQEAPALVPVGPVADVSGQELREHLRERLPEYMVPSAVVLLDSLPLTPNGKLDRKALPQPEMQDSLREYRAPESLTQELLAGIWSDVLGIGRVGLDDNFFELGGHSLLATQVLSRIRQAFSIELALRTLFDSPHLKDLARSVEESRIEGRLGAVPPLLPSPRQGELPLSFAQQRLWFLDQLEAGSSVYNIPAFLRLKGALNVDALRASLGWILQRHEVLRSCFPAREGKARQVIHEKMRLPFPVIDLQACPQGLREAELKRLAGEESRRPFDLSAGPLLRASLARLGQEDHALLATMHHIVSDGWSSGVLVRELSTLYEWHSRPGRRKGHERESSPLPELPIQYADFACWQRRWLSGEVLQMQLEYWQGRLEGAAALLHLPTDRPRPALQSYRGAKQLLHCPARLVQSLKALSQSCDATFFMTLLAAFQVLLCRYSGQEDLSVGTPIANRNRAETEGLIGFFVNTLVLRSDLSGDPEFVQLLKQVRQTALGAYDHQDIPFEQLVEALQPERSLSHAPLFQVMFVLQNTPVQQLDLPGLQVLPAMTSEAAPSKFDLTLTVAESPEGLEAEIVYSLDLFEARTIRRMLRHLQRLLEGVAADPHRSIWSLPLLTEEEREQILVQWNAGSRGDPESQSLHQSFEACAERSPDNPALVFGQEHLSYRELNQRANQLAHHLQRLGIRGEVAVGLCLERSPEMVIGMLAVLKAGGAYVPLDPAYPSQRLAQMLEEARVRLLLTQERLLQALPELPATRLVVWEEVLSALSSQGLHNPSSQAGGDMTAYVIYTSGSTGRPKGSMISHRSICVHLDWMQHEFQFNAGDRVLQNAPFSFDGSVWEIFCPLLAGACLVPAQPEGHKDAAYLIETVRSKQITTLHVVPSMLQALLEQEAFSCCPSLQRVMCGGEVLPAELQKRAFALLGEVALYNLYGPTEATVHSTCWRCRPDQDRWSVPIGRPVGHTQIYLLDRLLQPVPAGAAGELHIGGAGLARGYLARPGQTAARFIPDPFSPQPGARLYRSGDLARHREDGLIDFLGRSDFQVKLRGFRIELGEIEAVLMEHPGVAQSVAVVRQDAPGQKRLTAYAVPSPNAGEKEGRITSDGLRDFLMERLPAFMVPSAFVLLESIPLTPSGKMDRRALPAPEKPTPSRRALVAPRTPAEAALAEIWSEVLGLGQLGVDDNFFELGGDSILSIQIVAKANQAGLGITVKQAFQHQTIAELAAVAGTSTPIRAQQGLVEGAVPLTPAQHRFFELGLQAPHHWNQHVLLEARTGLSPQILDQAVQLLLRHHDALRLRFEPDGSSWRQFNAGSEESEAFCRLDLSALSDAQQENALESACGLVQASLDPATGPLIRAGCFELGAGRPLLLLMAIHHLAVDGVSWRVLLEDLQAACQQLASGQAPQLPAKTTSFKEWSQRLSRYAHSGGLAGELDYWLGQIGKKALRLPVGFPQGANSEASAASVSLSLSEEETRVLLQEVPWAYRTQINDVLLTALAQSLAGWVGAGKLLVDMEGHGREAIFPDLDTSRTVGWFSSVFPLALQVREAASQGEALKQVKEQLRLIPNRGLGYGLLRHLKRDPALIELPQAEVSFNYLGQFDQALPESALFKLAPQSGGPARHPSSRRRYLLNIGGGVSAGRLRIDWTYSQALHKRATIAGQARRYMKALRSLIAHCRSLQTQSCTPSDFPLAQLSQQELDQVLAAGRPVEDLYPLAPIQQGLLFHSLYHPELSEYVNQLTCRLESRLEVEALQRAWKEVVRKHPVLRTAFLWEGLKEPVQIVLQEAEPEWSRRDWRGLPPDEQDRQLEDLLQADRKQGFELSTAPLMRLGLIRLADEAYQFILSFHHLVLDGWSLSLILKEVFTLYDAFREGQEPSLPPTRPYHDYIAWLLRQDLPQAEAFWRRALQGFEIPTPLSLVTTAASAAPDEADVYGWRELRLSEESSAALQALARRRQLTLNTLMQGAWAYLLSRYSGEEDVVFGVTLAGRPAELEGFQSMVGLFINTLPLRVRVQGTDLLAPWLAEVQQRQTDMRHYEYSPLAEVQRWSMVPPGQPLFESILVFENYPVDDSLSESGLSLGIRQVRSLARTNYPLTLTVSPGRQVVSRLTYDSRRFDSASMQRMLGQLENVLEAIAGEPQSNLSSLPLLGPAERQQVLAEWNDTGVDLADGLCLHQLFEAQAQRNPEAPALEFKGSLVSYGELNRRADRLACRLQSLGVGPESMVGLCVERGAQMVVGLLGILKSGGAYVPLDPSYPSERLSFMLEDAAVQVLVAQQSLAGRLPEHSARRLSLDSEDGFGSGPTGSPVGGVCPENAAYVIYTSGSTGTPKGVVVEHRAIAHFTRLWIREYDLTCNDRMLQFSSISFDQAGEEIYPCLACGGRLLLRDEEMLSSASVFLRRCRQAALTMLDLPTAYWHQICSELALGGSRLPESLRVVMIGGERALPAQMENWRRHAGGGPRLVNGYGPTEATIATTVFPVPHSGNGRPGEAPIGRPLPNIRVRLMDPWLRAVPAGIPGELLIGGANLARGYLGRPDLTAERFVPDPYSNESGGRLYRSGDLAGLLPEGNIQFLGRIDHQVKVRGFRVELGEVEAVLAGHPELTQCAVLARDDPDGQKRLVAYLVFEAEQGREADGGSASGASWQQGRVSELRRFLKQRLPEHMVPSVFVPLQSMPMTPSGKFDRQALMGEDPQAPIEEWAPPRTPTEELLAGVWAAVLGVDRPGLHDNFFELGGHSLLATQAISRIRRAFQVELPLRALFEAPSLESFAHRIDDARRSDLTGPARPLKPVPRAAADLPLSFAQQRLWFLDQLEPHSALYNIPVALRLRGRLDIPVLKASLDEVVRRHESLRTRFPAFQGKPRQLIGEEGRIDLPVVDLGRCLPPQQDREVQRLARLQARRPFDLGRGPLLEVQLIRLGDQEQALLATMHHIVSDGWSMGLLVSEMTSLYEAFSTGRGSPLPEPPLQYADFAHWQRQWLSGAVLEEQLGYWKEVLADGPAALELPFDRPRLSQQSRRGAKLQFRCDPSLSQALKALSRKEDATLYMTLLAAFQTLLQRYSGQKDIVVGTPIANRNRSETESLIGFFVNTLVLRTDFSGEPGFRQVLGRVREVALGAYAHQDVPFEQVVEALQPERSLSRTPLFQVMFALQNAPAATLQVAGLEVSALEVETGLSRFDLTLSMVEGERGLEGAAAYSTELFEATTICRMLAHFQNLLKSLVAAPDQNISLLPFLSQAERQQLLREWNPSCRQGLQQRTIHRVFASRLSARPDAVAVTAGGESLSYAELDRRAGLVAGFVQSQGVAPDLLVGLFMERWHHTVVAMLGILKAGGAYLPLDPAYPQERLSFLLSDAGAALVLTQESLWERLAADGPRIACIDRDWASISKQSAQSPPEPAGPHNLAYVIYTSGSTGQPKGVLVNHSNVVRLFEATDRCYGFGHHDVWTFFHSPAFDFSVWEIWGALLYGGRVVAVPYWVSRSPKEFHALLRRERVTVLNQTPSAFRQLIRADQSLQGDDELALRLVIFGGEALDLQSLRPWFERHGEHRPQLVNMFGITETTVHVTYRPLTCADAAQPRGSLMGIPLPDLEAYILDRHLQPIPLGAPGEICIGGAGLSRGYLDRPGLTAQRFIANPFGPEPGARLYRSGDLARFLPHRDIEYLGRIDHQVKIRGFRIELGEIESLLGAHPSVGECMVLIEPGGEGQNRLAAYFTAKPGAEGQGIEPSASPLRDFLRKRLPEYMVPSVFRRLQEMPLTAHGKVDRKALPQLSVSEPEGELEAARTPVEELVAGIWSDVLGLEQVGPEDNFFDVGGHSLLATQVVSRIRRVFGVELALRALFEAPRLAALASQIEEALFSKQAITAPALVPASREQDLPLSFAQQRLWFLDQLEPGSPAYNIPAAFRLNGRLNGGALEAALNQVLRRHEALRTCFPAVDGKPAQKIQPELRLSLAQVDLSCLPSSQREAELLQLARIEAQRPFDLATGPLLRAQLVRLDDHDHAMLLTMHHIVSDGWSTGILVRELTALYNLLSTESGAEKTQEGMDSCLPELPIQYADFALWQRKWLSGQVLQGQLDYWKQRLEGAQALLELPADHPRPARPGNRGARLSFTWPPQLWQSLKALSRSRDATLYMTLMAAFQALLHRVSGQTDINVGSPIANRNRAETEGLIGFFVNTLVLRTDFSGGPSFRELVEQVGQISLGAYEHQDIPFEQLVEVLQPERSLNRAPLFQVMFIFQNAPAENPHLPGLEVTPLAGGAAPSKFDLTLSVAEGKEGLAGTLEYSL